MLHIYHDNGKLEIRYVPAVDDLHIRNGTCTTTLSSTGTDERIAGIISVNIFFKHGRRIDCHLYHSACVVQMKLILSAIFFFFFFFFLAWCVIGGHWFFSDSSPHINSQLFCVCCCWGFFCCCCSKIRCSLICSTVWVARQSRRFLCLFWRETRQRILGPEISPYLEVVRGREWELAGQRSWQAVDDGTRTRAVGDWTAERQDSRVGVEPRTGAVNTGLWRQ